MILLALKEAVVQSKLLLVACVAAAAGCGRSYAELSPAVGATPASGPGEGAVATAAGVRVSAHAQAWHFDPPDLESKVTPVLIELANNGDRNIVVRYKDIALTDAGGTRYEAIPPYNISGTLSVPVTVQDPYFYNGYAYAYRYAPMYVRYAGGFVYDPQYYQPYLTVYTDVALPTPEMVQRSLPEGAIAPGGTAGGFVYFKAFRRGERLLTLHVDMIDQTSGEILGTAKIPFIAN